MPPRSALFIGVIALGFGAMYLLFRLAFGTEIGFWETMAGLWKRKKEAYFGAKIRDKEREVLQEEHKEVCSRCKRVAEMHPYPPANLVYMYKTNRLCKDCVFRLTAMPMKKKGKK